jgi:hypothetical protein
MHPLRKLRESVAHPHTRPGERAACRKQRLQQPDPGTGDPGA